MERGREHTRLEKRNFVFHSNIGMSKKGPLVLLERTPGLSSTSLSLDLDASFVLDDSPPMFVARLAFAQSSAVTRLQTTPVAVLVLGVMFDQFLVVLSQTATPEQVASATNLGEGDCHVHWLVE